jgi:hypothetical protein
VGDAAGRTRARHWDGTSWNAVPLPTVGAGELMAVSAASASHVWAVAHRLTSTVTSKTLIERYTAP